MMIPAFQRLFRLRCLPTRGLCLLPVLSVVLLTGIGSLAAATYTWDPGTTTPPGASGNPPQNGTGTNGSGTWSTGNIVFATGGKDVAFPNKGNGIIYFGTGTTTNGNAGTVTVTDSESVATLRVYSTGSTAVNGVIPGYTFSGTGMVTANNFGLAAAATLTTFNVPLIASAINFNAANSTLSLNASSTIGVDSSGSPSPNIQGSSVGFGAQGTLLLNAGTSGTSATYTIGTSIAIGTTGTASTATGGVQVNAGAILTPSTASGALTDLGVGGYATNSTTIKTTNGSGLLMINGGTVTTGSSSTVYINNNAGAGTFALSGQLIVNSGALNAGSQIVVGNALGAASQSAELDVNGGSVLLLNPGTNAGSILLNQNATASGTATVNITGGVTTLGTSSGIVLDAGSSTTGSSTLNVSGGSLFLGSGQNNRAISDADGNGAINLSGGTIGAVNYLVILLPMTLSGGNVTFQTSNLGAALSTSTSVAAASASGYSVTLGGVISGAGSLTATNGGLGSAVGGVLTLTAANTYTGATVVNSGTLQISMGSINSSLATVNNSGVLILGDATALGSQLTLQLLSGSTLYLGFYGTDTVNELVLDGNAVPMGTYTPAQLATMDGAITFEGYGAMQVLASVPEPATWALLVGGAGLLGLAQGFRRTSAA